ncbi:uncharacterized protein BDW70DRAFT_91705 [Aspergillus foveolatus]|uniref:uncharacterized protein n=1 Tax=Aspergillus foveolatus TaxID=210207 RepID=UPI003CCCEA55
MLGVNMVATAIRVDDFNALSNFIPGQGLPRHSEHPDLASPKSSLDRLLDESIMLALDVSPLICSKRQIATATVLKVCGGVGLIGAKFGELETVELYGNDSDMTSHLPMVGETKSYSNRFSEFTSNTSSRAFRLGASMIRADAIVGFMAGLELRGKRLPVKRLLYGKSCGQALASERRSSMIPGGLSHRTTVDDPSGVLGWLCVRCARKATLILASSINDDNPSGEVLALLRHAFATISEGVL